MKVDWSKCERWCRRADLNRGPTDYESVALPLSYVGIRTKNPGKKAPGSVEGANLARPPILRKRGEGALPHLLRPNPALPHA